MAEPFGGGRAGRRARWRQRAQPRRGLVPPADLTALAIDVGGAARRYHLAPPPPGDPSRAPILVVLHGAGGQGPGMAAMTQLDRRGPAAGFVTVFTDGVGRVWNDTRGSAALARRAHVDDVGFLQALVAGLAAAGRGRADRVFLAGMSNGALMAEHVARHGLLSVAGLALVAGPGTQSSRSAHPRPAQACAVVVFAGTADPLIPYGGGAIGPLGRVALRRDAGAGARGQAVAAEDATAEWAAANRITAAPVSEDLAMPAGALPVRRTTWAAPGRPPAVLYRIDGGGHTWPGHDALPEWWLGATTESIDATELMWSFFQRHPLHKKTAGTEASPSPL